MEFSGIFTRRFGGPVAVHRAGAHSAGPTDRPAVWREALGLCRGRRGSHLGEGRGEKAAAEPQPVRASGVGLVSHVNYLTIAARDSD